MLVGVGVEYRAWERAWGGGIERGDVGLTVCGSVLPPIDGGEMTTFITAAD